MLPSADTSQLVARPGSTRASGVNRVSPSKRYPTARPVGTSVERAGSSDLGSYWSRESTIVRRDAPSPPPPQAVRKRVAASAAEQRMMFWRKQLTAWQRRENLRGSGSSVNQTRARRMCLAERARCVRSCKLRPFALRPSSSRMADRSEKSARHTTRLEGYVYRRSLAQRELIPAIGVGIAAGLAAYYVARLFLERTPLLPEERRVGKRHASGRVAG